MWFSLFGAIRPPYSHKRILLILCGRGNAVVADFRSNYDYLSSTKNLKSPYPSHHKKYFKLDKVNPQN